MTVQIDVEGKNFSFNLDWANGRWNSAAEAPEADFPLITVVNGKRLELYSDGRFAEVNK